MKPSVCPHVIRTPNALTPGGGCRKVLDNNAISGKTSSGAIAPMRGLSLNSSPEPYDLGELELKTKMSIDTIIIFAEDY
jgi:hypothetical protein